MQENASLLLKENQVLYISEDFTDRAFRVDSQTAVPFPSLQSNQEEADTRLVLHAALATRLGAQNIIVSSPDTDVLVLLLHHYPSIHAQKVYLFTGHSGKHTTLRICYMRR